MASKKIIGSIEPGAAPEQVDDFLKRKFGIGLYRFLKILTIRLEFDALDDSALARRPVIKKQKLLDLRKKILATKKKARESVDTYNGIVYPGIFPEGCADEKRRAGLEQIDSFIDSLVAHVDSIISTKKDGRPQNETVSLICAWGEFLKYKKAAGRNPWPALLELYKWAWNIFSKLEYYRALMPSGLDVHSLDPDYFQKQHSKNRARWRRLFGNQSRFSHMLFNFEPDIILLGGRDHYYRFDIPENADPGRKAAAEWTSNLADKNRAILEKKYGSYDAKQKGCLILLPDLSSVRERENS
jgi:hypothetical protein